MTTLKVASRYKLALLYVFCYYLKQDHLQREDAATARPAFFALAQSPLLSRYNRQPHQQDTYGCPLECHCNKIAQIADCSNRNLTRIPASFPKDIKRIRLERNNITEIGPYAFEGLKRLQRIDLSNNNLCKIDTLAFAGGLQALNSLILYSNKLEHLPVNVFSELSQLQLLLLNANSLQAIQRDLFQALANLNLLSLYDNNIATLPRGTFDGLKNIKTIHLGKNPLECDCNLRWLVDYFESNPVETSEARCETPGRVQGRKLSQLTRSEFKCQEVQPNRAGADPQPTGGANSAAAADLTSCPAGCICNGSTVDCSQAPIAAESRPSGGGTYELPDVPDDVPVYVARVHINDNRIKRIRQTGLFRRLAQSQKLDLGNSKIVDIEDNAINGQFANGQKPERVVFVLLENQHCDAPQQTTPTAAPGEQGNLQTKSSKPFHYNRQQQQTLEDPCASAPKVNEPHFDSACYNGGVCKSAAAGQSISFGQTAATNYSCSCLAGFAGSLCEINIDDCVDHQCQNGAMCVDGINSYKCVCRDPTTTGEFCEQMSSMGPSGSYASNSAASNAIAPLALPIIAASGASLLNNAVVPSPSHVNPTYEISTQPTISQTYQQPAQQIIARSADNLRATTSDDFMESKKENFNSHPPPAVTTVIPIDQQAECQRVTLRKYFDDGNGCQSVRVLKISECAGSCAGGGQGAASTGASCCLPAKVKRRRIRMQCSDGASYVKTVDLIKKCSCEPGSCQARSAMSVLSATPAGQKIPQTSTFIKTQKDAPHQLQNNYYKYMALPKATQQAAPVGRFPQVFSPLMNATELEDQALQITRLDAIE